MPKPSNEKRPDSKPRPSSLKSESRAESESSRSSTGKSGQRRGSTSSLGTESGSEASSESRSRGGPAFMSIGERGGMVFPVNSSSEQALRQHDGLIGSGGNFRGSSSNPIGSRSPIGSPPDTAATEGASEGATAAEATGAAVGTAAEGGAAVAATEGAVVGGAVAGGLGAGAAIALTGGAILVLAGAAAGIAAIIEIPKDNDKRAAYTQQFVQQAGQKYPGYNVVICHPQHSASGANVIHQHYELPMALGTCGYDIFFSPKGKAFTFVNQGDGGFINWAFNGEFNRNGNTLTAMQHA